MVIDCNLADALTYLQHLENQGDAIFLIAHGFTYQYTAPAALLLPQTNIDFPTSTIG